MRLYWMIESPMKQNYVADGALKKRMLIGIKLTQHLVVHELALIKDLLTRV